MCYYDAQYHYAKKHDYKLLLCDIMMENIIIKKIYIMKK